MKEPKQNGLIAFMSRHMMACDEAGYLISKSYDTSLSVFKKIGLRFHLMTCHLCRKYAKQLRQLNLLVEEYRETCECGCEHQMDEALKTNMNNSICKGLD